MRSYIIPVVQALLVHALVIGAFTFNWESDTSRELPPPPQVVQAKVLTMADPIAARKEAARKKAEAKRRAAEKRKKEQAKRKAAEKKKAEAKKKADAKRKVDAKKKADIKKKADAKKKAEAKKKSEEQKRAEEQRRQQEAERQKQLARETKRREQELAQSLADEMAEAQEEDDRVAAQSYDGLVRQRIMENWHIPLSARNGMVAKVMVHFLPTGEINTVALYKSSGDSAFDRSVVLAVERVGKIEELQQLEPRVFDKFFRKRIIKFRPEDLDR